MPSIKFVNKCIQTQRLSTRRFNRQNSDVTQSGIAHSTVQIRLYEFHCREAIITAPQPSTQCNEVITCENMVAKVWSQQHVVWSQYLRWNLEKFNSKTPAWQFCNICLSCCAVLFTVLPALNSAAICSHASAFSRTVEASLFYSLLYASTSQPAPQSSPYHRLSCYQHACSPCLHSPIIE